MSNKIKAGGVSSSEKKRGRREQLEEEGFVGLDQWRPENPDVDVVVDSADDLAVEEAGVDIRRVDTLAELMGDYEEADGGGEEGEGGTEMPSGFTDLDGLD
jgi:hypothetical protein